MTKYPLPNGGRSAGFTARVTPVDLLEIFHARGVREQVLAQLRRLKQAQHEARLRGEDSVTTRHCDEIAVHYQELALMTDHLLVELGDGPAECSARS